MRNKGMFRTPCSDFPYVKHGSLHVVKQLRIRYSLYYSPPLLTNHNHPYHVTKYHQNWQWIQNKNIKQLFKEYKTLKKAVRSIIQLDETFEETLIDNLNCTIRENILGERTIRIRLSHYFRDAHKKYIRNLLSMFLPGIGLIKWTKVHLLDIVYFSLWDRIGNKPKYIKIPFWMMLPKEIESIVKWLHNASIVKEISIYKLWPYCTYLQWVAAIDSVFVYVIYFYHIFIKYLTNIYYIFGIYLFLFK